MSHVTLRAGHVRPIWAGHPWVYAQAIERIDGAPAPGDDVEVRDPRGQPLGTGLYSPGSAIPVRLHSRAARAFDGALLRERLTRAVALREALGLPSGDTTGYRVVHAEGDGLPGLIVDRLGDVLAVQLGTVGLQRRRDAVLDALEERFGPAAIVDRTPRRAAELEGFPHRPGLVRGAVQGGVVTFSERGLAFELPLDVGQKTGFYLDQRPLRARVEALAKGRRVLDVYSFVGAVGLAALRGGASSARSVDSSGAAIAALRRIAELNALPLVGEERDALEALRAEPAGAWELLICDPPKLAPSRAAATRAERLLRQLAAESARVLAEDGLLVLCSCSAAVGGDALARAAALGARDAGRTALELERVFQGADHPVPAAFPEGRYLVSSIFRISTD